MASIEQRETRPIGWSLPPKQCDSKKKMGCRRAVDFYNRGEGRARNRPILLRMPRANCSSGHYLLGAIHAVLASESPKERRSRKNRSHPL